MRKFVRHILIAALAAATALPALADARAEGGWARDKFDGARAVQEEAGRWNGRGPVFSQNQPRLLPLEAVLASVATQLPRGDHVGVDGPMPREGRWIYRIKWLTKDGRVLIVFADAQTGQVLGIRG
jgi:hypothetical protein